MLSIASGAILRCSGRRHGDRGREDMGRPGDGDADGRPRCRQREAGAADRDARGGQPWSQPRHRHGHRADRAGERHLDDLPQGSVPILARERRRRLDAHRRAALVAFLRELPISLDGHTAEQAWSTIAALAERRRLTLYDAAYLELAQRRRLPLATLDRELAAAAGAEGVAVLGT